jgi:hypothetical protein
MSSDFQQNFTEFLQKTNFYQKAGRPRGQLSLDGGLGRLAGAGGALNIPQLKTPLKSTCYAGARTFRAPPAPASLPKPPFSAYSGR